MPTALASAETSTKPDMHAFEPQLLPATTARIRSLRLPPGFQVSVFAKDLGFARMLAVADDGTVYVTRPQDGDVLGLAPGPTGTAVRRWRAFTGEANVHGIALRDGKAYLASPLRVLACPVNRGGTFGAPKVLINDLPAGVGHGLRTVAFGPDGHLYVSVGSTCNVCLESDPGHATIQQAGPDGRGRRIFASGLRNTIGFGWHPQTHEMWGMDHGVDGLGDNQPPEELNHLVDGGNYGWPFCYGDRKPNPTFPIGPKGVPDPSGKRKATYCQTTIPPVLGYQAHSAPIGMVFYSGTQFPSDYRGDAFVAFHGSWNRIPATGCKVVRIHFEHGRPVRFEDFLTGFLLPGGKARFGRPAGLAVAKDGSLLVGDDANGVIYRVAYHGR